MARETKSALFQARTTLGSVAAATCAASPTKRHIRARMLWSKNALPHRRATVERRAHSLQRGGGPRATPESLSRYCRSSVRARWVISLIASSPAKYRQIPTNSTTASTSAISFGSNTVAFIWIQYRGRISRDGRGRSSRRTRPGIDSISVRSRSEICVHWAARARPHVLSTGSVSSVRKPRAESWLVLSNVQPRVWRL